MEAQLKQAMIPALAPPTLRESAAGGWRDVVFNVATARRALPYVSRIAADAADAFHIVQSARERLSMVTTRADRRLRVDLCEQRDRALSRLNSAIDECNAVGAHLVDLATGQISLPAMIADVPACLLWRLGDDVSGAWADLA
jgi:hypothetical protein